MSSCLHHPPPPAPTRHAALLLSFTSSLLPLFPLYQSLFTSVFSSFHGFPPLVPLLLLPSPSAPFPLAPFTLRSFHSLLPLSLSSFLFTRLTLPLFPLPPTLFSLLFLFSRRRHPPLLPLFISSSLALVSSFPVSLYLYLLFLPRCFLSSSSSSLPTATRQLSSTLSPFLSLFPLYHFFFISVSSSFRFSFISSFLSSFPSSFLLVPFTSSSIYLFSSYSS